MLFENLHLPPSKYMRWRLPTRCERHKFQTTSTTAMPCLDHSLTLVSDLRGCSGPSLKAGLLAERRTTVFVYQTWRRLVNDQLCWKGLSSEDRLTTRWMDVPLDLPPELLTKGQADEYIRLWMATCQHIFSCLSIIHTPTLNMELVTQKRPGEEPHLKPQFKVKFQWCTCQPAHPSTCIHVDHPLHGWIKPWSKIIFGLMKQYLFLSPYHLR